MKTDTHNSTDRLPPSGIPPARVQEEADRLFGLLRDKIPQVTREGCEFYAPWIAAIHDLKKRKNAVVLAHSYVQPLVLYGVADVTGDSLFLSQKARDTQADVIVFAGVRFMAETAKILNPKKTILLPALEAGCSLADAITARDVIALRKQHPGAWAVCYINTTAEVKAECDACCTSGNMLEVINAVPTDEVIFVPDRYMAQNLQARTKKKLWPWDGACVVHEAFAPEDIEGVRRTYRDVQVLVHPEAPKPVADLADFVGSTEGMMQYIRDSPAKRFMMVTECGLSDRARVELPGREFFGLCILCPYMKMNELQNIYRVLRDEPPDHRVDVPEDIRLRAFRAVDNMFKLMKSSR